MKHVVATFLSCGLVLSSTAAFACSDGEYIGSVCVTAGAYCPQGTVDADGSVLQIKANPALFAVIGKVYGGDGLTTFALPDLRGRVPVGLGQGPGLVNVPAGTARGAEMVKLSEANLPAHIHSAVFAATGSSGTVSGPVSVSMSASVNTPVTVSGPLKIANANATAGQSPGPNSVLTKARTVNGSIYAPSGTSADIVIGPTQTFTGQATGVITGTATGNIDLPVTDAKLSGTVTVKPSGEGVPVSIVSPQTAFRYCVVTSGYFPPRP